MTMAMRREESAAKLPDPRPDLLTISLGNFQAGQRLAWEELKTTLAMDWR